MVEKQSARFNIGKIQKGVGIGLAVSIVITIVGVAIGAWLLATEKVGEGNYGYITVFLLLLSSILGAFAATKLVKEKRMPICLSVGVAYFLSLLAITALFFGGTYSGVGESALVILGGVLSVALLGINGKKRTKKIKRK